MNTFLHTSVRWSQTKINTFTDIVSKVFFFVELQRDATHKSYLPLRTSHVMFVSNLYTLLCTRICEKTGKSHVLNLAISCLNLAIWNPLLSATKVAYVGDAYYTIYPLQAGIHFSVLFIYFSWGRLRVTFTRKSYLRF